MVAGVVATYAYLDQQAFPDRVLSHGDAIEFSFFSLVYTKIASLRIRGGYNVTID